MHQLTIDFLESQQKSYNHSFSPSDSQKRNTTKDKREIKHHVYGKRERQKYHVIMNFPPFFMFAVFNVKRPVLTFVNNASIPLKFFIRSVTVTSPCLRPGSHLGSHLVFRQFV